MYLVGLYVVAREVVYLLTPQHQALNRIAEMR